LPPRVVNSAGEQLLYSNILTQGLTEIIDRAVSTLGETMSTPAKRRPHFTEAETIALSSAYAKEHAGIVKSFGPQSTRSLKQSAWLRVLAAVNAVGIIPRGLDEVKTKHKNLKKTTKEKAANNKHQIKRTGGGQAKIIIMSTAEDIMSQTLSNTVLTGINGGIDIHEPMTQEDKEVDLEMDYEMDGVQFEDVTEYPPTGDPLIADENEIHLHQHQQVVEPQSTSALAIRIPLPQSPENHFEPQANATVPNSTPKPNRKRVSRSWSFPKNNDSTVELLQQQVGLMTEQVAECKSQTIHMASIASSLDKLVTQFARANEIRGERLDMERGQLLALPFH